MISGIALLARGPNRCRVRTAFSRTLGSACFSSLIHCSSVLPATVSGQSYLLLLDDCVRSDLAFSADNECAGRASARMATAAVWRVRMTSPLSETLPPPRVPSPTGAEQGGIARNATFSRASGGREPPEEIFSGDSRPPLAGH